MTKYEKETIINFNEEESTAVISTYNNHSSKSSNRMPGGRPNAVK